MPQKAASIDVRVETSGVDHLRSVEELEQCENDKLARNVKQLGSNRRQIMNELSSEKSIMVRYGVNSTVASVHVPRSLVDSSQIAEVLQRRGSRIVIDCGRGPEIAETLGATKFRMEAAGVLVRVASVEDELISAQLAEIAQSALLKCNNWLDGENRSEVLLQIEPLLDGQTVFFHFLEQPSPSFQDQLEELLRVYEEELASSEFVKKVATGCGPGCGTTERTGAGCGSSCSGCSVRCSVSRGKA